MQPNQVQWPKRIAETLRRGFSRRFLYTYIHRYWCGDACLVHMFADNTEFICWKCSPSTKWTTCFLRVCFPPLFNDQRYCSTLCTRAPLLLSTKCEENPIADINECGRGLCVCITYVVRWTMSIVSIEERQASVHTKKFDKQSLVTENKHGIPLNTGTPPLRSINTPRLVRIMSKSLGFTSLISCRVPSMRTMELSAKHLDAIETKTGHFLLRLWYAFEGPFTGHFCVCFKGSNHSSISYANGTIPVTGETKGTTGSRRIRNLKPHYDSLIRILVIVRVHCVWEGIRGKENESPR